MRRSSQIACFAGVLAVAASCKVYDDSLLLDAPGGFGGSTPTENGLGWWSGTDPATKCPTAGVPTPDDRPSSDSEDTIDPIVFAVRSMRLGSLDADGALDELAWQDIGFDLDGVCTRSPTCDQIETSLSCKTNSPVVPSDGKYCRDNMFGKLEYVIATNADIGKRFGLDDRTFNCSLCEGAYNMLFKISDYNGQPNDNFVRVDIYPSPGLAQLKSIDCETAEQWDQETDCWAKDDAWTVQSDYVTDPVGSTTVGKSRIDDPVAYVRDGYAVVRLPANTRFWFPDDRGVATAFPLVVEGGVVTGKLEQAEDGSWTLTDGIISGRMDVQDAIDGFRFIGMCEGDPLADTVVSFANTYADLLASGEVLPDAPCDALSVGIAFTASEATIGAVTTVEIPDPCPPDAGTADAGTVDAGTVDAGTVDAGTADAADGGS